MAIDDMNDEQRLAAHAVDCQDLLPTAKTDQAGTIWVIAMLC